MTLRAGAKAVGADFQNLEVKTHAPLDSGTTTSTTFTTTRTGGTSPVGVAFTGPPSGKVMIHFAVGIINTLANPCLVTFQVLSGSVIGSGTPISGASDSRSIQSALTTEMQAGRGEMVDSLASGASYNVSLVFRRLTGGTFTANRVSVTVVPCIA